MNHHYDTIVVGGGIVGASAAYYLAKTGQKVVLLDKGRVPGEQSSRNWGEYRKHKAYVSGKYRRRKSFLRLKKFMKSL